MRALEQAVRSCSKAVRGLSSAVRGHGRLTCERGLNKGMDGSQREMRLRERQSMYWALHPLCWWLPIWLSLLALESQAVSVETLRALALSKNMYKQLALETALER